MTRPTGRNQCVECGNPAERNMVCDTCAPDYADIAAMFAPSPTVQASMGDECGRVSCRSDLAGLAPCEGETASTMEDDRG